MIDISLDYSEAEIKHVDYIGTKDTGEIVMGLAKTELHGIKMTPDPNFVWTVPSKWSNVDAATVPYAYTMVNIKTNIYISYNSHYFLLFFIPHLLER